MFYYKMAVHTVLACIVVASLLDVTTGYSCYKCSYGERTEGTRRECIEDPDALGIGAHLQCNSTSFCVLQEQYDIHAKKVTSYFRSCSGNTWGNHCDKDWSHVTCRASCQGNYCNLGDKGDRYVDYLEKTKGDPNHPYHNGAYGLISYWLIICVTCLISVLL